MVKKIIKYPLKMKNGAEVRSLEELRANADVESVMQYYFSGQLSRWCKAFDINELPEKITENNEMFVNSVLETIGVVLPVEDVHNYVNNNFGNNEKENIVSDDEEMIADEKKITDDKEVKNRLKDILNRETNLDDYQIEMIPIEGEFGKIKRYSVYITNEKSEQYSHFIIPYEMDVKDLSEKDLYRKMKYAVENAEKSMEFFNHKIAFYESLNVGDTFDFGSYDERPIRWKIIKKSFDSIQVIATEELCKKKFHHDCGVGSNEWINSDLRIWLNGDFYSNAFTEQEKEKIDTVESDKVSLLSREEADILITEQDRVSNSGWWLKSRKGFDYVWYVYNGEFRGTDADYYHGVRPTLNLHF